MAERVVGVSPVVIDSGPTMAQEKANLFRVCMSKERLISLLKSNGVRETAILEKPEVRAEQIIPTLRKAKLHVSEQFFMSLASEVGLPFLTKIQIRGFCDDVKNCGFLTILPYPVIETHLIIPLEITSTNAKIALSNPLNKNALLVLQSLLGKRQVDWYLASSEAIEEAIEKVYGKIHKQNALMDLYYRSPNESAHSVLLKRQKYVIVLSLIAVGIATVFSAALTFAVLFAAINVVYFLINPLKIYISLRGFQRSNNLTSIARSQLNEIKDEDLPIYTVLVPVFHESEVLGQVMRNIYEMDYPKNKLDVKILIEEKDEETRAAATKLGLFGKPETLVEGIPAEKYREFLSVFEGIIIPNADITTKPRACNYGLLRAKGKYCVIYDAEDKPDQDQIRKAAIAFSCASSDVACLQSKLNFYNANENVLAGWFSVEYSYWYDFYLQGLDKVGVPIPLGGTSNHFRIDQLQELGSWDPYNVTEDADLGLRIARRNYRTEMLECYTYEEATLKVWSWIKQRSRWYKGHAQTYLVHMRYPVKLLQDLGWKKFMLFQFTFGASIFMPLVNPLLWLTTAVSIVVPSVFAGVPFLPIEFITVFNLVVGNLAYLFLYSAASIKNKKYRTLPLALTMPLYWVLISISSWRGLKQLITKPFYWEKTVHGVTKTKK